MSTLVRACSVKDVAAESAIPVEVPLDGNGSTLELAIVHSNGAFYAGEPDSESIAITGVNRGRRKGSAN